MARSDELVATPSEQVEGITDTSDQDQGEDIHADTTDQSDTVDHDTVSGTTDQGGNEYTTDRNEVTHADATEQEGKGPADEACSMLETLFVSLTQSLHKVSC